MRLIKKKTSFKIENFVPNYSVNDKPLVGLFKLAFICEDINSLFEKLTLTEVNFITSLIEDSELRSRYFIVSDPDGNALQFIEMNSLNDEK